PYPRYDVNQDGEINILDLTLVGHHFGELVT
ncbi:dockerin type I domain-containing protein, partial [Methanosarcina mazei]